MAMNFAEAGRMVDEGRIARVRLFGVSYYRRLYPKLVRAKQLIAEGAIGRPLLAEANCHGWLEIAGREWLADPALSGGGPLYDIASHRIDAMNFFFGKPERACGLLSNAEPSDRSRRFGDRLMRFAGGVHAVVDVRWNSRVARDQFRIIGEGGEIDLDPLNGPELRCARVAAADRIEMLPPHANIHFPIVENFVDAVRGQRPRLPGLPGRAGRMDRLGD